MAGLIRHGVAAGLVFAVLVSLCITIYTQGLEDEYNVTAGDQMVVNLDGEEETGNIMEQLKRTNLIEGVSQIDAGIAQLGTAGFSALDILGGLASVGVGALKTILGLLTAPYTIVRIVLGFYAGSIPGIIGGLVSMFAVYAVFILLSAYLKKDV